ncbi:MAG: flagellar protein FliS [Raoultibacter sp.]
MTQIATEKNKKRKQPLGFYVAIALAAIAVVLAGFFAFKYFQEGSSGRDPNAALGQLSGKTQEEVQAELDRMVEEGMFNISIASSIVLQDGMAEGDVCIENIPSNRYLMQVEITRDDTGETLYKTGLIEPNHHIQSAKLDVDLDAGTYPCTAVFYAHDAETEELVGQAAAKISITVKS